MPELSDDLIRGLPAEMQERIHLQTSGLTQEEGDRFSERMAAMFETMPSEVRELVQKEGAIRREREAASPVVGDEAPEFELAVLDGNSKVSLSSLRGKPVGLIFGSYT
jgi:hypothetical protein